MPARRKELRVVQCQDCGRLCGTRHSAGLFGGYYCNECYRKHQSNAWKCIGGVIFLALAAILSAIVSCTVLRHIASSMGFATAKYTAIGLGVGGCIMHFVLRSIAGKVSGCLFRAPIKLLGLMVYALGVGMLILTFLCENQLKACCGVAECSNGGEITS